MMEGSPKKQTFKYGIYFYEIVLRERDKERERERERKEEKTMKLSHLRRALKTRGAILILRKSKGKKVYAKRFPFSRVSEFPVSDTSFLQRILSRTKKSQKKSAALLWLQSKATWKRFYAEFALDIIIPANSFKKCAHQRLKRKVLLHRLPSTLVEFLIFS